MSINSFEITLPFFERRQSVLLNEIVSIEADRNYTEFRFRDGSVLLTAITLKRYEERIVHSPYFCRLNRSFIVNLQCVAVYDDMVTLLDGRTMQPSRRRVSEFKQKLKGMRLVC